LKIGSLDARIGDFSGPLPPQRSASKDDCLSAVRREFRLCREARRCRGEKGPARKGIQIFKPLGSVIC
jgi:hypothetical protein